MILTIFVIWAIVAFLGVHLTRWLDLRKQWINLKDRHWTLLLFTLFLPWTIVAFSIFLILT